MEHPATKLTRAEELLVHLAGYIRDYSTFWSLCLASRAFYRIFRGYLWADIVWDDGNDGFFADRDRLAHFIRTHTKELDRAHSLRGVKLCEKGIFNGHEEFSYLTNMEVLQSYMPNLKSYE